MFLPLEYKLYRRRWLILLSYCLFSFSSPFGFYEYSPILKISSEYFNQSEENLIWLPNIYPAIYVLFSIFTITPMQIRLDYSLYCATFLNTFGYWINYFGKNNFYYQIAGFCLIGTAQLFLLAAPAYISDRWFGLYERTFATSVASFANMMGTVFAFMFPAIYFKSNDQIPQRFENMNLIAAIISSVAFLLSLIFIQNKPKSPPSFSSQDTKLNIFQSLKAIMKMKILFNMISLCVYLGISWTYTSCVSLILENHGYEQNQIGVIGMVYTISGVAAGLLGSIFLDKQIRNNKIPKYDLIIKGCCTLGLFALLMQAYLIDKSSFISINILSSLIGIGFNAYYPIAFQSFIESNYPSFELVITTSLMVTSNLFCFCGSQLMQIKQLQPKALYVLAAFVSPFYIYMMINYKTMLKRLSAENNNVLLKK